MDQSQNALWRDVYVPLLEDDFVPGASMDWWEQEFCERLASGGRFVIRYDHRDTGRSVSYPPGAPDYTFQDLVADAVGLLDHFRIESAHLVGR